MITLTRLSVWAYIGISAAVVVVFAFLLYVMGQPLICECGFIKFWHGPTVLTSENSQHIADWYTFSHIIHGFGFYFLFWLIGRKRNWPVGFCFLLSLLTEVGWELFENTDFIINRYRTVTISYDYFGDSVLNSVCDVFAMMLGFVMAHRLPVWVIIAATIGLEVFVGFYIRDNLTLNIIMLFYPFEYILEWQRGG